MRCPDCCKFVSNEVGDLDLDAQDGSFSEGSFDIEVRIVLCCADCGNELAEANLEAQFDLPEEVTEEWEFDIEGNPTERFQDKYSNGKSIPHRFQKHFYGYDIELTCTPPEGSKAEKHTVGCYIGEQASGFEQLN